MANFLKQIRKARGLTQDAVADRIGTSTPHYQRLESGKRTLSEEWLRKCAHALEVKTSDILEGGAWGDDAPDGEQELVDTWRSLPADEQRENAIRAVARPITAQMVSEAAAEMLAVLSAERAIADSNGLPLSDDAIALIAANLGAQCERLALEPSAIRGEKIRAASTDYLLPLLNLRRAV